MARAETCAAALLDLRPGLRVLDACAAPGGKTGHLLEIAGGDIDLLAVDSDADRLAQVAGNLERLRRQARLARLDLRDARSLAGEGPFDRILIDAPCSATGVIRRHPDIKLLRRPSDIPVFARAQRAILDTCFARLLPGGRLVYATCSVLAAENGGVVERFVAETPAARRIDTPEQLWPGVRARQGPGTRGADGSVLVCDRPRTARFVGRRSARGYRAGPWGRRPGPSPERAGCAAGPDWCQRRH